MRLRKVCVFLPSAHRDGAELSCLEFLETLIDLGLECLVVLPQMGPLWEDLKARGIPSQLIPYRVWIEPPVAFAKKFLVTCWNLVITIGAVFYLGRRHCDLIITNTINVNVGALTAKVLGLPHIWYIREFGREDHGWQFHWGETLSYWLMNRLSQAAICVSQAVAHKYRQKLPSARVHYAYQPIQLPAGEGPAALPEKRAGRFTCIMVGRLQEGKGQEEAVRAVAELANRGLPVDLWLVGGAEPKYHSFLKELVAKAGLIDQVRFWGQVDNALPYIRQADVLLLCSRSEAFARVVVEAMKAGKPVIGTKSGGTVEQIQEGWNGLLYSPGNYRELAKKIKFLHDQPEVRKKMGEQGQHWALATFTRERYRKRIQEILNQLP
ncbi:MAG: glycosyltransferase [Desulfobaccales bacterium]